MKNQFIYVDGENVNLERVESYLKENLLEPSEYVGKVYGSKDIIGSSIGKYLLKGFVYVETSTLSVNKKNLADMKIVADCIADACLSRCENIHVHILSADTDFLPAVYKLRELGVSADVLSLNKATSAEYTQTTLYEELQRSNYFPVTSERAWNLLYEELTSYVCDDFPKDVLDDYIQSKKDKLAKELDKNSLSNVAEIVRVFPNEKFSLDNFMKLFKGINRDTYCALVTMFTRKVYGITLKSRDIEEKLK